MKKTISSLLVLTLLVSMLMFSPQSIGAVEVDSESVAASTVKTRDEAVAWLRAQEGARYDIDGAYGSQCSDFTSAYVNYLLTGNPYGGRIGVYNANQYSNSGLYPSDWQVIQNTASFVPEPGDIFIVNGSDSRYGHTGVVISSTVNTATIADQNGMSDWSLDYGSPAHIHNITWTGSGTWAPKYFIRPCFGTWHNPEGVVDIIEGGEGKIHIRGWAFDSDNLNSALEIHVYIGGRSGDSNAEGHNGIIANASRPDVNNVYGCGDWHGFDAEITTSKRGNQPVYVYALNIGGGNDNPQIGEGTATVKEPNVSVTSVTLNKTTLILEIGKSDKLIATVTPTNATDKTVNWTSSDSKVATVSNGTVTAVSAGTATITAKTTNGKIATCAVTVKAADVEVTGITLNKSIFSLDVGKSETLTATVAPSNATNKTVTWISSKPEIATVSNGVVTAKAVGTTTITAKSANGKTATCQVTVKSAVSPNAPQIVVENKTVSAGVEFSVEIEMKNNPGVNGWAFDIGYNSDVMELIKCDSVAYNDITTSESQNANPYHVQWFGLKDDTTNGVIAKLTFKAKENVEEGDYPIDITYDEYEIGNEKDEQVHFDVVNGIVKIAKHMPGDVNGDGRVNLRDVIRLNQFVAGWKVTVVDNSTDINGDGRVNLRDVIRLNQYVAGWKVEIQ